MAYLNLSALNHVVNGLRRMKMSDCYFNLNFILPRLRCLLEVLDVGLLHDGCLVESVDHGPVVEHVTAVGIGDLHVGRCHHDDTLGQVGEHLTVVT